MTPWDRESLATGENRIRRLAGLVNDYFGKDSSALCSYVMVHTMTGIDGPSLVLSCPTCGTLVQAPAEIEDIVCWQCGTLLLVRQRGSDINLELGTLPATLETAGLPPSGDNAEEGAMSRSFWRSPLPTSAALGFMLLMTAMVVFTVVFWVSAFRGKVARSPDGRIELSLPAGWEQFPSQAGIRGFNAANRSKYEWLYVRSSPKQDFKDLRSYDAGEQRAVLTWLSDARSSGAEAALVNGRAALRSEITGTTPRGVRVGYVMTALATETRFSEVLVATDQSRFPYRKSDMARLAYGFREAGRSSRR